MHSLFLAAEIIIIGDDEEISEVAGKDIFNAQLLLIYRGISLLGKAWCMLELTCARTSLPVDS